MPTGAKREVTVNEEQRLYVIPTGYGYTCLGFDVCERRRHALAEELIGYGLKPPVGEGVGTIGNYRAYDETRAMAAKLFRDTGKRCVCELHPMLKGSVGVRVKATYADGHVERFIVGRSTGWTPVYIKLNNINSTRGCAIDVSEPIVKVERIKRRIDA